VVSLLYRLRKAGAAEQAAVLLRRDPAARVSLDDPRGVAFLLGELRESGAAEQAAVLLRRDPAGNVSLDDPDAVASLLYGLLAAGAQEAQEQAAALADRLGTGMPGLFPGQQSGQDRFRFGREADDSPSAPWGWDDLN